MEKRFEYKIKVSNAVDSLTKTFIYEGKHPNDQQTIYHSLNELGHRLAFDFQTPIHEQKTTVEIIERKEIAL